METINLSAFKQLYHNGALLEQAKETLYDSYRDWETDRKSVV